MTKYGVLFERDNFIKKCINRAGYSATLDIAGGTPIVEGAIVSGDDELYTVALFTTGKTQVGIAFNPSVKYDVIGDEKYPARSEDDRNYYNIKALPLDYFIPEVGVEFGVQMANITGDTAPEVGEFLECTNTTALFTIKTSQTDSVPSFEVVEILDADYMTGDFTDDTEKVYIVKTRKNG